MRTTGEGAALSQTLTRFWCTSFGLTLLGDSLSRSFLEFYFLFFSFSLVISSRGPRLCTDNLLVSRRGQRRFSLIDVTRSRPGGGGAPLTHAHSAEGCGRTSSRLWPVSEVYYRLLVWTRHCQNPWTASEHKQEDQGLNYQPLTCQPQF